MENPPEGGSVMRTEKSRMNLARFFIVMVAAMGLTVAVGTASALQNSPDHKVLFEKAKFTMETKGDLKGAIALFEEIIKKYPNERDYAANSLLYIGMCYEKLGKSEARNAYSRLVQDYGDQAQPVKEARSRLARMEAVEAGRIPEKTGLVFRKLDFPGSGATPQIRLSPDGRKVLYIGIQDEEPRYSIRVFDFTSGKSKTLVEGIDGNYWTHIFCWSPDANRVVYLSRRGELMMINPEGGKPVPFWAAPDKETEIFPLDWSGQNHSILVSILNGSQVRFAMIPENGGEARTIVSGDESVLEYWAQFSPDGKFIVGRKTKDKNNDVYVWAVDGSDTINITNHPADDSYPYWSPDGKYIVFLSDRSKTVDLWAVSMAGSQPAGNPIRIQANIGKNKAPTDFTKSGQLVFDADEGSMTNPADLFVLPVDPKTNEAQGLFQPYAKYPLDGLGDYRWSPDGQRIAYTSRKGNLQLPNAFISSGGANEDLEIQANEHWMPNIEWSPDGKNLLFPGWNREDDRVGIFRISLEDRTIKQVHVSGERLGPNWKGSYWSLRWLPLARKYIFHKTVSETEQETYLLDPSDYKIQRVAARSSNIDYDVPSPDGRYFAIQEAKTRNFMLLSLEDGVSKVISTLPPSKELGYPFSWSPDGKKIAWIEGRKLKVMTVPDGTPQTLFEAAQHQKIGGGLSATPNTAWSPDGIKIAFFLQDAAPDSKALPELWIIGVSGGLPRKIADAPASHSLVVGVVWHPSGKMIFAQGLDPKILKEGNEHWVMENFLPNSSGDK
jgi:Tol biopolymer transport system component